MRQVLGAISRMGQEAIGTNAEEVLDNAKCLYEVDIEPIYTKTGKAIRSKFCRVFRKDNDDTLGVVSKSYRPVQNMTAVQVIEQLVDMQELDWHRVGMVGHGEKFFISAKLPETLQVKGWDSLEQYIYIFNTHDGSGGFRVILSNMVIGCQNQYQSMLADYQRAGIDHKKMTLRHSHKFEDRLADLVELIQIGSRLNHQWVEDAEGLMEVEIEMADRIEFYLDTFGIKQNEKLVSATNPYGLTTRGNNTVDVLLEIEKHPTNNHGTDDNAFKMFNTITYYLDHHWTFDRKGEKQNDKRVESAIIGSGARMKSKAWNNLVTTHLNGMVQ